MEVTKKRIRHILLYEFIHKGNNATKSARNIKAVYGDRTISVSQRQRWFQKFQTGNYSLEASFWKICKARRERPANPGGTKSHRNCWGTSRETWIWSFDHSSTPACHRKSQQIGSTGSSPVIKKPHLWDDSIYKIYKQYIRWIWKVYY